MSQGRVKMDFQKLQLPPPRSTNPYTTIATTELCAETLPQVSPGNLGPNSPSQVIGIQPVSNWVDTNARLFECNKTFASTLKSREMPVLNQRTLNGHTDQVRSVAFSLNGAQLASASDGNTVRIWDVAKATLLHTLKGHTEPVYCVAFSPNVIASDSKHNMLASGSADKTVRLWFVETGFKFTILEGHTSKVNSVAFSPNGKLLASASSDRTVRVWHIMAGATLRTIRDHTDEVYLVAFSPNNKMVASGSLDTTVRIWNALKGHLLQNLQNKSCPASLAFLSNTRLVSASVRSATGEASVTTTVRHWSTATGSLFRCIQCYHSGVTLVALSLDGKRLASSSPSCGIVRIWDSETGEETDAAPQRLEDRLNILYSFMFSPDQRLLASAFQGKTVELLRIVPSISFSKNHSVPF